MGFITLKDGTVIHASLLNNVNVKPSDFKISVADKLKPIKAIVIKGTAQDLLNAFVDKANKDRKEISKYKGYYLV